MKKKRRSISATAAYLLAACGFTMTSTRSGTASKNSGPTSARAVRGAGGELLPHRPTPTEPTPGDPSPGTRFPSRRVNDPGGLFRLSPVSLAILVLTILGVATAAVAQLVVVFLSIAPLNPVSQPHVAAVRKHLSPEFEQNWRLFAPNPVSSNLRVQARAKVLMPDGSLTTTGWMNLTAMDEKRILHNPFPSHTNQNEIRIAWNSFVNSRDEQDRPIGLFGNLTQEYVRRIAVQRLAPSLDGGRPLRVQLRSADTPVSPPPWSKQRIDSGTVYQVEPWGTVDAKDFP
ncbi:DUF5819 family protein [Streptomyces sp. NPDC046805]|uniref:DUF5819 family protein n=1 Tax=Streptomyces sp. NPDC046805 TaxID=3155134 RepID=UPI0033CE425F